MSRKVNLIGITANLLLNLKEAIGPRHDLGLALAWNLSFLIWIHNKSASWKWTSFLCFDLRVNSFNPLLNLSMEFLDLFGSLLGLPTKFGGGGEWIEVQWSPWVTPINYLKRGEPCGIAWCSIEDKLYMGEELIPPLDILSHKYPK